jgi:hypothetical protein
VSQGEKEWAAEHQWKESAGLLLPVNSSKRQTEYPLQESVEAQVEGIPGLILIPEA